MVVDETWLQGLCGDRPCLQVYDLGKRLEHLQKFTKELCPDLKKGGRGRD